MLYAQARSFANITVSGWVLMSAVRKACFVTDNTFGLVIMSHINNQQLFLPLMSGRSLLPASPKYSLRQNIFFLIYLKHNVELIIWGSESFSAGMLLWRQ